MRQRSRKRFAQSGGLARRNSGGQVTGKPAAFHPTATCLAIRKTKMPKNYIPELSEVRMINRAPQRPVDFGSDRDYVFSCLKDVERAFEVEGFPGIAPEQIPVRSLVRQLIVWWRTLEPHNEAQQDACGRLPGVIRLIDTISGWLEELNDRGSHS